MAHADPTSGLALTSVVALRAGLLADVRVGAASWMRLDGVGLDSAPAHSAFCHGLTRFGFGATIGRPPPATAVLDWSCAQTCGPEGFAFFSVLARRLMRDGVRLIGCKPSDASIAHVLSETGLDAHIHPASWAPCVVAGRRAIEVVARPALFGSDAPHASIDDFCDDLSAAVRRYNLPRDVARLATGAAFELVQNVLAHAGAGHAAAVALVLARRRPPVLQLGIADDGVGIVGAILTQPRHQWLGWFSDASAAEIVLQQSLSGRDGSTTASGGGGGMGRLIRRLLHETRASVALRTGTAHIRLHHTTPDRYAHTSLTYGAGTQFRLELPLA